MTGTAPDRRVSVVVLIDALGWEIVRHFEFARGILPAAGPLGTVLGYSSAAIPSLLSGTTPSEHGAWAMYRYSPQSSPFRALRMLPRLPHALEWRMRRWLRKIVDRSGRISGYYDLYEIPPKVLGYFDIATQADPYTPGSLRQETLFDRLEAASIPYLQWNYRTPETENFDALCAALDSGSRLLFLYTAELDALMHRVGIFHDDVEAKLRWYEDQLSRMERVASSAGIDLDLFVFSDHGMTNVEHAVDLMLEVQRWGYRMGRDVVAFFDSTMARFWCLEPVADALRTRLEATGWGRVVGEEELEAFGCRFEDDSYGEIIFLLDPGRLIVPSYMSREAIAAMHGYDPDDRFSKGCFMSRNRVSALPQSILELKNFLLRHITEPQ